LGIEGFDQDLLTVTTVIIIASGTDFIIIAVTLTTVDAFSIAVIKFKNSEVY
jgi:hypothetical protein